jgi:hypothetical protein
MTKRKFMAWAAPPGSIAAQKLGCLCSVVDNLYGKGRGMKGNRRAWIVRDACPLHGLNPPQAQATETKPKKDAA